MAITAPELRAAIARIEARTASGDPRAAASRTAGSVAAERAERTALGHAEADASLGGGLRHGALHEVFAADTSHGAAAAAFALGLARRVAGERRAIAWIRQDFAGVEIGEPSALGLLELGLDPARFVIVRVADATDVLRAAGEALACPALGAAIIEPWGATRGFDLQASRRLTLAAGAAGVTALALRLAAVPLPSAAETRWLVRAVPSPCAEDVLAEDLWGAPLCEASLVRNRHGRTGRWLMEWRADDGRFRTPPHPGALAAEPADRSSQAA